MVCCCFQTGSLLYILQSPGCEEHYSCSMIDADWNATQCLACSISYCRVGCIHALISFLTGVTLYVWSWSYVNLRFLRWGWTPGHTSDTRRLWEYLCLHQILCSSRVEVQGQSGNMIPFVMFNYQLTPHLSPRSTLLKTTQAFII